MSEAGPEAVPDPTTVVHSTPQPKNDNGGSTVTVLASTDPTPDANGQLEGVPVPSEGGGDQGSIQQDLPPVATQPPPPLIEPAGEAIHVGPLTQVAPPPPPEGGDQLGVQQPDPVPVPTSPGVIVCESGPVGPVQAVDTQQPPPPVVVHPPEDQPHSEPGPAVEGQVGVGTAGGSSGPSEHVANPTDPTPMAPPPPPEEGIGPVTLGGTTGPSEHGANPTDPTPMGSPPPPSDPPPPPVTIPPPMTLPTPPPLPGPVLPAPVTVPTPMQLEPVVQEASSKPRKIQVDLLMSPNAAAPSAPTPRDIIFGLESEGHQSNLLLLDLIALHKLVWEISHDAMPKVEAEVEVVTERLFQLMKKGKGRDLAGMKDVPRSFLVGSGRFMQKEGSEWKELSDEEAKKLMRTMIFGAMHENGEEADAPTLRVLGKEFHEFLLAQETETETQPLEHRPSDVILLQRTDNDADKSFNNQSGNKSLFTLASQHVHSEVKSPSKRLEAALSVFLSKNPGPEVKEEIEKPRFILCRASDDGQKVYSLVKPVDAAEVTLLFVFEVWLEKELAARDKTMGVSASDVVSHDDPKPSTEPIETPTPHDVLFGRGGMTNSHPGNKRFRDVIALHRPDYIKAIKNDKPNVARRIVRAIRTASPPGRFLKKSEDGYWYDVGNRIAAEKASQALREKSNAEKRQRSAQREAMRNKREGGNESGGPSSKKAKVGDAGISIASPLLANQLNYVGAPIVSAVDGSKVEQKVVKVDPNKEELKTEGLPPNAVDKDGNILVTDWDILAGRGGLTNHHRGNKRFRDIVALHRPDYIRAPKVQKPSVARVIVRAIRNGDPPGRFLKKDEKTGKWYDIGDKKAAEKTSQALREKGNDKTNNQQATNVAGDANGPKFLLPSPAGAAETVSVPPLHVPEVSKVAEVAEAIAPGTQAVSVLPVPAPVPPPPSHVAAPDVAPVVAAAPALHDPVNDPGTASHPAAVTHPGAASHPAAAPHHGAASHPTAAPHPGAAAHPGAVAHTEAASHAGAVLPTESVVPTPVVEAPAAVTAMVAADAEALETALDAASKLPPETATIAAPAIAAPAEAPAVPAAIAPAMPPAVPAEAPVEAEAVAEEPQTVVV